MLEINLGKLKLHNMQILLIIIFENLQLLVNTIDTIKETSRAVTKKERAKMTNTMFNLTENLMKLFENHIELRV